MKSLIFIFSLLSLFLSHSVSAEESILPFKQVSVKTSQVFCTKMDQCAQGEKIPIKYCVIQMNTAFEQNYAELPAEKKVKLTQPELDKCLKQIQALSCEKLKNAQKIPNCEFIEQLSS